MSEERIDHMTMLSPREGFLNRVMARIEARERARARNRALIGVGLLAAAIPTLAMGVFVVGGGTVDLTDLVATITFFVMNLPFDLSVTGEALATIWSALAPGFYGLPLLAYAFAAFALTMLWLKIAQTPQTIFTRGAQ